MVGSVTASRVIGLRLSHCFHPCVIERGCSQACPFCCALLMASDSAAPLDPPLVAALGSMVDQEASREQELEDRRKSLKTEAAQVTRDMTKKGKMYNRLLEKAAPTLSPEACLALASRKRAAQAKSKARVKARS